MMERPPKSASPSCRKLPFSDCLSDERGAFMVAGVFMMLVVVSLLYVLIGTAHVIVAREGMQDAADASALAAAIFMARGMNLIALINLLMALLLSILVAFRLIQTFFIMASVALYSVSWYFGISAPAATACKEAASQMGNIYDQAKEVIMPALEVMHEVQEGTSVVVPFLAVGTGALEAAQHHKPAQGAFALPAPQSLPVESDKFEVLCGRATEQATTGAFSSFASILPVPDVLTAPALEPVEKLSRELGEATSNYLCGDGSGSPPQAEFEVEQSYPGFSGLEACQADPKSGVCLRAEEEWQISIPQENDPDGSCAAGADCSYDGLYETVARQARRDCEPKAHQSATDYTWQKVAIESVWTYNQGRWTETSSEIVEDELVWQDEDPPCGRGGTINRDAWEVDSGPRGQSHPTPLCVRSGADFPTSPSRPGDTKTIEYEAALRIFSCTKKVKKSTPAGQPEQTFGSEGSEGSEGSGGGEGGDGSQDKSPHKMQDVALGSETFQVRAIAFGPEVDAGSALKGVKISLLRREEKKLSGALEPLRFMNRFSIAQSEYYFDHDGNTDRREWLWEMKWKARLKRVTLPSQEEENAEQERQDENQASTSDKIARFGNKESPVSLADACSKISSACPSESEVDLFAELVKH